MTNRSKAKGTTAETAVVRYLSDNGIKAHRKTLSGSEDKGDISVQDDLFVIEVKNEKRMSLAEYVDEAELEAANTSAISCGVAWHKRRGKANPGEWYVTMKGKTFLRILKLILNLADK